MSPIAKQKVRVSFILPTRNRPKFLKKTLERAQKYITSLDELIVVDGSSDDSSQKIVALFPDLVSTYIRCEDISEGHKLNIGILNSSGRIIKPITDDDLIFAPNMEKAIVLLDENQDIGALQCGGEGYVFDEVDKKIKYSFTERIPSQISIQSNYTELLKNAVCHLGLLFKREILPKIGLYDSTMAASDIDIMSKIIKANIPFKYFDVCLYRHIQYQHSSELQDTKFAIDRINTALKMRKFNHVFWESMGSLREAFGLSNSYRDTGFLTLLFILHSLTTSKVGIVLLKGVGFLKKMSIVRGHSATIIRSQPTQKPHLTWTGELW